METLWTILSVLAVVLAAVLVLWNVVARTVYFVVKRLGWAIPCPARFGWFLEHPVRRRWTHSVLERAGVRSGERVLEVGAGTGVFTLQAAERVGPKGRVIAVDLQPEMAAKVQEKISVAGLSNVEVHTADVQHLPLEDNSIDRALLISVLGEVPAPARALKELYRVVKPGGALSITEEFLDPDYALRGTTRRRAEAAGFHLTQSLGNFWFYTLNFQKPP